MKDINLYQNARTFEQYERDSDYQSLLVDRANCDMLRVVFSQRSLCIEGRMWNNASKFQNFCTEGLEDTA